ncbi:carbonic anhydrase family protein [Lacticaseibacillus jixiensis]|uniref:carbonic anhydrase family protein n=1 Tax=Lacticaseibacillus jixiensis TaxID=3231926 RepID=UPI0036F20A17
MTLDYTKQAQWPNGFGQQQSPVALHDAKSVGALNLTVTKPYQMTQELDDGTTIKLLGSGAVTIGEHSYHAVQAHFHSPAEHSSDLAAGFEVHFVHQTALGQLCVVAVLLPLGAANATVQQVIDRFAHDQHSVAIDLTPLWPKHGQGFHYLGSLTTPPLTEGVEWYVLQNHDLTLSAEQAAWFRQEFGANNRDLQPLAKRVVERFDF